MPLIQHVFVAAYNGTVKQYQKVHKVRPIKIFQEIKQHKINTRV